MSYSRRGITDFVTATLESRPAATLKQISRDLYIDRHTINKAVREVFGKSFRELQQDNLIWRAQSLLTSSRSDVQEVARDIGLGSPRSLQRLAVRMLKLTPKAVQANVTQACECGFFGRASVIGIQPLSDSVLQFRLALQNQ